ncbi:PREDICTED: ubiquitin-conjugating enzyme E2 8-like [Camelina sativa]|uniref:Ubiquitin-conjugating enzyme E2 8-like n=1 Tax=Camelina sativa TaxID=90675 RepID=A0ABM0YWK4_CAMSA|nr:PREDICTED: ubiquitin-conjugating enzyme E2 8-like [Camelina sativa]
MEYWEIPESVSTSIRAPSTCIPSGRRKKKRIASSWEHRKAKTNSKQYKCSRCVIVDDSIFKWEATLIGPVNTPYEGAVFKMSINFPPDYPNNPPKICFVTKICHPNISDNGAIYLRLLKSTYWHPMLIILLFKRLVEKLIEPEVDEEDQINKNLANLYKSDRARFEAMAREITNHYAGRGN